jgi:hypothetical protein
MLQFPATSFPAFHSRLTDDTTAEILHYGQFIEVTHSEGTEHFIFYLLFHER